MDAQKIIGLPQSRCDWLRRYYGRLSGVEARMIHEEQTRIMRRWVDDGHPAAGEPIGSRSMLALIAVLDRHQRATKATGRKSRNVTPEQMDAVEQGRIAGALAAASTPKRVPKKKQLMDRRWFGVVVKLRREGLSWMGIEKYLRKHHRYSASGDYIRRACSEIVTERGKRGEDMTASRAALRFQQPRPRGQADQQYNEGGDA